ncbi:MAG TPA: hypothetical protein VH120_20995, partial [Gemmataceae bacterium]|nr:hypothetical protein [Gemmataceae bacterium]
VGMKRRILAAFGPVPELLLPAAVYGPILAASGGVGFAVAAAGTVRRYLGDSVALGWARF